jgi:hypothetical protein
MVSGSGMLPQEDALIAELTAPTYSFTSTGKMVVESKADTAVIGSLMRCSIQCRSVVDVDWRHLDEAGSQER